MLLTVKQYKASVARAVAGAFAQGNRNSLLYPAPHGFEHF